MSIQCIIQNAQIRKYRNEHNNNRRRLPCIFIRHRCIAVPTKIRAQWDGMHWMQLDTAVAIEGTKSGSMRCTECSCG